VGKSQANPLLCGRVKSYHRQHRAAFETTGTGRPRSPFHHQNQIWEVGHVYRTRRTLDPDPDPLAPRSDL